VSSAQRLPNDNTLITEGNNGRMFEVTRQQEIVWEYLSPYLQKQRKSYLVYRAYRVPYEWVPQVEKPQETAIPLIDISSYRVPGSVSRKPRKVVKVRG